MPSPDPDKRRAKDARRRARNAAVIASAKDRPCASCGVRYPPRVMDLHHRDPSTKVATVAEMRSYGLEALRAEIAKCDVLCANCHRLRH